MKEELQDRIDIIRHKLKFIEQKPTVLCIEKLDPLTMAGNAIPGLVAIAGGASILAEADQPSPQVQWVAIRESEPDIIIIMPEGFTIEHTIKNIGPLLQLPGFIELKAVKNNRLYIANGNEYFNPSEEGLVDAAEILAEIINPKQFIFGYEGAGWLKFSL